MTAGAVNRTQELLSHIAAGIAIHDLGRPYQQGMPQSPNHPKYSHSLPRRHGDMVRSDGGSAANDLIVMGTHVGTHIDALAHVSHCGLLHGGLDAAAEQVGGKFMRGGIQDVSPIVCRGVLLDVPGTLNVDTCRPGYEITVENLQDTVAAQHSTIGAGDVVLIRSGWGAKWGEGEPYQGLSTGVPGVGADGATWLAAQQIRAAGADTIAFEQLPAGAGHAMLPAHRILLVDNGINIIETLNLEDLAAAGVYEFLFVLSPLPLIGATGSPVRPLAVVAA